MTNAIGRSQSDQRIRAVACAVSSIWSHVDAKWRV